VPTPPVETLSRLTDDQASAVQELVAAVTASDGARPLSDAAMLRLSHPADGSRHLLLWSDGADPALVGYAHLETSRGGAEAELAVTPDARSSGAARLLLDQVRREAAGPVGMWAHGSHSGIIELAREAGFSPERVLLQLRRPLDAGVPLDEPEWPQGVTVRTFVPGQDEAAWLEVNNRAFADHPDQSGWSVDDVTAREAEDWFDPAGFFLAVSESDGAVVGFHWTKVHPATDTEAALGEVYIVGIDPSMRGRRLGPALTLAGLRHLRDAGLATAMLYVDESNPVAVQLYERLGFTRYDSDIRFSSDQNA
jgi:mycothiol synthase